MNAKTFSNFLVNTFLFCLVLLCLAGITSNNVKAQKDDSSQSSTAPQALASPTPILNPGGNKNPTCAQLNASGDAAFSHITTDYSLKLDQSSPNGTFPFTNGPNRELVGPSDPGSSLTISSTGSTINSFSSTRIITAVIVKGGNEGANVYPYSPATFGDTHLTTPDINNGISHVTSCFSLGTTAATAKVSGRVKDVNGKAAGRVSVTITNISTGEVFSTRTDLFGRYAFTELATGEDYLLRVFSGRRSFKVNEMFINLLEDITDADFTVAPAGSLKSPNQ